MINQDIACEKCNRKWQIDSEQSISIEIHNECIVCKFTPAGKGLNDGTLEQLSFINKESARRRGVK